MRISTAALHQNAIADIVRNQARLAATQTQLATGTRLATAADDPQAFARAAALDQRLAELTQFGDHAGFARHRLSLEETALASAGDTLNRVRELALQANSATQSAESRRSIALELGARLDELLASANSDDGDGRFLFGGSADAAAPFSLNALGATYGGDQNLRTLEVGPGRSVSIGDAGDRVFQTVRSGNGVFAVEASTGNAGSAALTAARVNDAALWDAGDYTLSLAAGNYEVRDSSNTLIDSGPFQSGTAIRFRGIELSLSGAPADGDQFAIGPSQPQDVFATVQKLIALVQSTPADAAGRAQQQTAFFGGLAELDRAQNQLVEVRSTVGNRLSAIDNAEDQTAALSLQAQATLSGLRDLDYAEATGRLNLQITALQAAQQSYVRVQGLSLFDFLR